MDAPHQPNATGFDALDELDQVDWSRLEHCYGKGVVSQGVAGDVSLAIAGDVSRSLAALRADPSLATSDGLYSKSLATSMERLSTIRTPKLVALIQAIQLLLVQSTDARRDAVESAIDVALTPPATPP